MKKVLKFYSETCSPCKLMGKRLAEIKNIEVQNINIEDDDSIELMEKWNIKSIPTIIIFSKDDELIARFNGIVSTDEIKKVIDGGE